MNNLSGNPRVKLSGVAQPAESEVAGLMARARTMMAISALTTVLAIAAVVTVIGYRMYGGGFGAPAEEAFALPKGAHIVSMVSSAGRIAVMIEVDGKNELRVFDIKTLKETGRLHFSTEP
jgi:hypothetical protein